MIQFMGALMPYNSAAWRRDWTFFFKEATEGMNIDHGTTTNIIKIIIIKWYKPRV